MSENEMEQTVCVGQAASVLSVNRSEASPPAMRSTPTVEDSNVTLAALSATGSRAMHRYMSGNDKALSKPIAVGGRSWTTRIEDKPLRMLLCCPPEPGNVAELRHAGALILRLWGLERLTDVATLLISELVTNALLHGRGTISCSLTVQIGEVRLQVDDGSPGRPCVAYPDPERESGRGMWLVDRFSDRWGTSEDGTSTWCTLVAPCGAAGVEG